MGKRTAFTLVELLVVIAIIGLLISILFPAISYVREGARITHCRNNLKQIAIAFNNYEGAHKLFPGSGGEVPPIGTRFANDPAGRNGGRVRGPGRNRNTNSEKLFDGGPWMVQIMPDLEETELQNVLNKLEQPDANRNEVMREAVRTPVPVYNCVSRRNAESYPLHRDYKQEYGATGARTDYAINGGASSSAGRQVHIEMAGVWMPTKRATVNDFIDGLSKTYLVGEKAMEVHLYTKGNDRGDLSPVAGWHDRLGAANSYVRYAIRPPARDVRDNCLACHDFGGPHVSGWNVVMVGGSVRSIHYDIDVRIHRAFASIDGEDVTEERNENES